MNIENRQLEILFKNEDGTNRSEFERFDSQEALEKRKKELKKRNKGNPSYRGTIESGVIKLTGE